MKKFVAGFSVGFIWALVGPGSATIADYLFSTQVTRYNARKWPYHKVDFIPEDGRDWRILP